MTVGTKDRKKLLVVVGLGVVLVAVVVVRLLPGSSGAGDTASASSIPGILEPHPESALDADPTHLAAVAKVAKARSGEAYAGGDLRDPMAPLVGGRASSGQDDGDGEPAAPAAVTLPPMSLYGIVWDPANPVALIDGNDVHVGETVKGARVVSIEVDRVVLSYRSRQFVLTVE